MELQTKIHINTSEDKEVVERLVQKNLDHKINHYINKFDGEDVEGTININIEKNKKWLLNWVLQINIDWNNFRYEREDFKNLDDLVNHLFKHFKEEISKKQ